MEPMKQFIEKRKKTIQEETSKFRIEYDAVIAYLNSTMQKAETNCRELTNESDYDGFRKKCVPSLNWLQEQYEIILLMRSLCGPTTSEPVVEAKSDCLDMALTSQNPPVRVKDGDEASVNESSLSDTSTLKENPCLVSSHPVTSPNLSVDTGDSTPGTTVEKCDRCSDLAQAELGRPNETKEQASVYEPALSDTSTQKERSCSISSLPVTSPNLPADVGSRAPDTTVQKSDNFYMAKTHHGRPVSDRSVPEDRPCSISSHPVTSPNLSADVGSRAPDTTVQKADHFYLDMTHHVQRAEMKKRASVYEPTVPDRRVPEDRPCSISSHSVTSPNVPADVVSLGSDSAVQKADHFYLDMTHHFRPVEMKDQASVYEPTLYDISAVKEKQCSVSSRPVISPYLPADIGSRAPDTAVQKPDHFYMATTHHGRPAEMKEPAYVYEPSLSDISVLKERPRSVSSLPVSSPYLPANVVSRAIDTAVQNSDRYSDFTMTNEARSAVIKGHEDDTSVYESALSEARALNGKSCSVSSPLPVTYPNLPVDLVSPRSDTMVQSSARSTTGSVVSSLPSESGKTKNLLEISYAIPKYRISETTVEVMATLVSSPYMIWVQVKQRMCELEDLLEELTTYHKKLKRESPDYRLHSKPQVGQLVSAQFTQDDVWYRAYVLAVFELPAKSGLPGKKRLEMDVGYVDYGNTERLPLSRVRPLPEKFRKLPFQAFICSLSEIGPTEPTGLTWSDDVLANFNQMDCTQLLTVRFSKPLPGCPIMFFDILNSKHLGSSEGGSASAEVALTEKMIAAGRAVRMPDNRHVARWYRKMCAKDVQPVNPGEKMVASLTHADIHNAHMPTIDVHLFQTADLRNAQGGKSCSNNDRSQHQDQLLSMSSANSGQPQQTEFKPAWDRSRPSVNNYQPLLPELQQSNPDFQVESHEIVYNRCLSLNNRQALLQNVIGSSQAGVNMRPVFEHEDSHSEAQWRSETWSVSSEAFNNDLKKNSYMPREVSTTSDPPPKVYYKPRLEGVGNSLGQGNVSGEDWMTSSGTFMNAVQSSEVPSNLCGDQVRVHRKGSRDSYQQSVGSVPPIVDCSGSSFSQPTASSYSLQEQKFHETKAYVEALASSGWPEKIARNALCRNEDDLGNDHQEDLSSFPDSPSKTEFCGAAGYVDMHAECPRQDWERESELELVVIPEKKCTHKPDVAEVKQYGQEEEQQTVTWTVSQVVVPDEGFIRVVMSYLESPSRFWVHLINECTCVIDYIGDELRRLYNNLTPLDYAWITDALKTDEVLRDYGICCARSSGDGDLYRAEVVNDCTNQKFEIKVKVFYIDFGNSEWIDPAQMLPLPPSLLSIPPLAIRCSLEGLEPAPVNDDKLSYHWSQEAIDVFTDLCGFTQELHGHFPSPIKPGDAFYVSRDRPLRLLLEIPNEDYESENINQRLLSQGLARQARQPQPSRDGPDMKETKDEMDNWDPMAEDFLSHRNSYKVDIDDPGVATVNYKAQDERRICKFFNSKNSRCWRGDDCPYEHVSYGGVVTTTDRREVIGVLDDELQLELPPVGSWIVVNVTYMIDPSHFFVVLPFGTRLPTEAFFEEGKLLSSSQLDEGYDDRIGSPSFNVNDSLEYFMDSLQERYRSKVYIDNDLTVYAEGETVVVRYTKDERWYRAKIITSDPDNNQVEVLYLDFGNTEWVDNERIRQIEADFLYFPFQAVECRLPLCANNDSGKIWSDLAKNLFVDLITAQFLVAQVVQRGPGPLLYVELYNTRDGDVNINKTLLAKGYARRPDSQLVPRSPQHHGPLLPQSPQHHGSLAPRSPQHHGPLVPRSPQTASPRRDSRGPFIKDRWDLQPG